MLGKLFNNHPILLILDDFEQSLEEPSADPNQMLVPPVAVGEDRAGRFVFVLEASGDGLGVTQRRAVTVGDLTSGGLEVLSGIESGETVVTAGVRRIADGMTVRLSPAASVGAR